MKLTTETTQTQRAQKEKPCLPVLLLGIIHQQTLAQEALLSTETSELEFGCLLCSASDDLWLGDEDDGGDGDEVAGAHRPG